MGPEIGCRRRRCRRHHGRHAGRVDWRGLQRAEPGSPGRRRAGRIPRDAASEGRRPSRQPRAARRHHPAAGRRRPRRIPRSSPTACRGAEFVGFRIVGDAATPLGTGVLVTDSDVVDRGRRNHRRRRAWPSTSAGRRARACWRATFTTTPARRWRSVRRRRRGSRTTCSREMGCPSACRRSVIIEDQAEPRFSGNVFQGVAPNVPAPGRRRRGSASGPRQLVS